MAANDVTFSFSVMACRLREVADALGRHADEMAEATKKTKEAYISTINEQEALSVAMASYLTHVGQFRGQHVEEVLRYFQDQIRPQVRPQPEEEKDGTAEGITAQEDQLAT
jgi:hypothetical protein